MSFFDSELWIARAEAKHQKSITRGDKNADEQLNDDRIAIDRLNKVTEWCRKKGLAVVFCHRIGGVYLGEDKMIRVSDQAMPRLQLYFLLHECGHFLIGGRDREERFGMGWHTENDDDKKTFHHRCDVIEEEFEAWYRGWRLGKRLRLHIDKSDFDHMRVKMIKTYMKWCLRVKGYGINEVRHR